MRLNLFGVLELSKSLFNNASSVPFRRLSGFGRREVEDKLLNRNLLTVSVRKRLEGVNVVVMSVSEYPRRNNYLLSIVTNELLAQNVIKPFGIIFLAVSAVNYNEASVSKSDNLALTVCIGSGLGVIVFIVGICTDLSLQEHLPSSRLR